MKRRLFLLLAVFVTAGAMACNEQLNSGAVCPSLCPAQNVPILDTVIDPLLVFDSVFVGYPDRGLESEILLATRGDTIQTVGIVRFDTLTTFYTPANDSSHTITSVDSAQVRIVLNLAQAKLPDSVRFEVYDVDDTVANDSSAAAVLAKFRPDRRLGQLTVPRGELNDTTFIPLSDSAVLSKITNHTHLRLGFRLAGSGPVSFRMETVESGNAAQLWYRGTPDTTIATFKLGLYSATPIAIPEVQSALTDFGLVVKNSLPQFPHDDRGWHARRAGVPPLQCAGVHHRLHHGGAGHAAAGAAADGVRRCERHDGRACARRAFGAGGHRPSPGRKHHHGCGPAGRRLASHHAARYGAQDDQLVPAAARLGDANHTRESTTACGGAAHRVGGRAAARGAVL